MKRWVVVFVLGLATASASPASAQGRVGSNTPAQQAYAEGMDALGQNSYPLAEKKFREAINLDTNLVDAYPRLGALLYRSKKFAEAAQILRKCPDQQNLEVKEQLGLNLYASASPPPADAVALLEDVAQKRPEAYAVQVQLGQHFLKSEPKKAAAAFEAYFKYRPSETAIADNPIHMKLGTAYVLNKDWTPAKREFDNLLRAKPGDLQATLMLGTVYVGSGACKEAIALYQNLMAHAPKQPSIYYNVGSCYLRERRYADAERMADQYIKVKQADYKGYMLAGDAFTEEKNYSKALASFQQAEKLDPQSGPIKSRLGRTYLALKNYGAAKTVLEQAIATLPNDTEVMAALADVYATTGAPKEKLLPLAQKLGQLTGDAAAQTSVGAIYLVLGDDDAAAKALTLALQLDPTSSVAKDRMVRVENRQASAALGKNDLPRAERLLNDALRLLADDPTTARNLCILLLEQKRYADAESAVRRGLTRSLNDVTLNRLLGRALAAQKKGPAAIIAYEKAATLALKSRGPELAGVYAELGPLYVEAGRTDQAVTVLEQSIKEAAGTPLAQVGQRNLALAYLKRGSERLRETKTAEKPGEGPLDDFMRAGTLGKGGVLTTKELGASTCGEALAALKSNKVAVAEEAFTRAAASGGCAFKPPYDRLGLSFFAAYAAYRDGSSVVKRENAAKTFSTIVARAAGGNVDWIKQLLRSAYELLAFDFYTRGDEKKSTVFLRSAAKLQIRGERRELDHNLAALDLAAGKTAAAERVFDTLNGRPPESLVNLGIVRDRQGEPKKALELYRRAQERGAHAPKLKEWIDLKERLFENR